MSQSCVKGRQWCPGPDATLSDPPRCTECIAKADEQRPSKEQGHGVDMKLQRQRVEQSLDWALNHGHKFGDAYLLANEVIRLRRTLSGIQSCSTCEACRGAASIALGGVDPYRGKTFVTKPAHEREPPHCSSCGCGLAPEPAAEPAPRYQCMVKGCPANHVSKRDVCDTRPCEAIALWLDADGNFQWDLETNEDHPIDATIAIVRRTNWVMTDAGWRLAQPPRDGL